MSFADNKTRKLRLHILNEQRAGRIRMLIERGLIKSHKDVPAHAIPIDLERSTKVTLIIPPPYYEDFDYDCIDCGRRATWLAETQQYYFEVLRESPYQKVVRCSECQATWKHSHENKKQNKPCEATGDNVLS